MKNRSFGSTKREASEGFNVFYYEGLCDLYRSPNIVTSVRRGDRLSIRLGRSGGCCIFSSVGETSWKSRRGDGMITFR
jgi:hypothetical protein